MSTPAQPSFTACAVSRTESGRAQQPVPGIMRAGSIPASTSRSASCDMSSATLTTSVLTRSSLSARFSGPG